MQCPNCHLEQPEGAESCQGCGLIFAKWRERHPEASTPPESPATAPEAAAPPEGAPPENSSTDLPGSVPLDRRFKPLPERQYSQFPIKKFAWIAGIILVAAGVFSFWHSSGPKDGYAVPKPIPLPTSISGSAYQSTVYPTDTPWPCGYPGETCTPTPIATPMTISGPAWQYHGKVVDTLHLSPISGAVIVFSNNGVAVTATSDTQGLYQISVPPLSGTEAYEVQISQPAFRDNYWLGDSSDLSQQDRMARAFDRQENQHLRGKDGGGGDEAENFSLFPSQLTEQEQMQLQNAKPSGQ